MKPARHLLVLGVIVAGSLATLTWLYARVSRENHVDFASERDDSGVNSPAYRRILMKDHIADELAEGKLNLLEAAAHVRDMQLPDLMRELFRISDPGDTEEERLCRHILDWTALRVADMDGPKQAARVKQRLEAELHSYLRCHGGITLPPSDYLPPLKSDENR